MQFNYFDISQEKHIDESRYLPIAVITSFQKNGKFIPLKVQVETGEGYVTFDITQVGKIEDIKEMVQFDCMYRMNGVVKPIRLYYIKKQHQWVMERK